MIFVFGEFELDPDRYELRDREGEAVRVEPKVLELLAYLIRHRDRVVAKDELFEAVWEGRVVGESALTRCVYQARRALGDSTSDQRIIRTVIGRGYRFVADVEVIGDPERASSDASSPAPEPMAGQPAPHPPPARGRRWPWPAALALAVLGFAVWTVIGRTSRAPPQRAPSTVPAAQAEVALLPIAVPAEGPDLGLLGLSMTDLLWARLASLPGLLVRPPETSAEAVTAAGGLAGFAARSPAAAIVRGRLEPSPGGSQAILSMILTDAGPSERLEETPLGSFQLPLPERGPDLAEFVRVREAVAERIVRRLAPAVALGSQRTPDDEAYRLYLEARQRLQERHCDGGVSLALIERSLERDPEFPLTWYLLASASYSQVWACGADASHFDRALEAARRARKLAPDLLEPQLIEATILVETGAVEEAYALLRDLAERHPQRAELRFEPAYPLRYAGYLGAAEALVREGLRMDPLYISTASTGMTPNVFLYRNDLDEFLHYLPDSRSAYHLFYRGLVEVLRGDHAAARAALDPAFRENPGTVFGGLAHALLRVVEDDPRGAATIVRQVASQRQELGAVDGEITYKQAQILALAGDRAGALEQLARAVEQGFFCLPYLRSDPALRSLDGDPAYERVLALARAKHEAFGRRFDLAPEPSPPAGS